MTDTELNQTALEAWKEAIEITETTDGWKDEKKNDQGDVVVSKKNKKGKKIYRVIAKIPIGAEKLIEYMKDTDKICQWNTTLVKHEILKKVDDKTTISYQITTEGGGGVVSSRDFVFLFRSDYRENGDYVQGGTSIEYPSAPKNSKIVRAWNGPGAQIIRPVSDTECTFIWLMDCEYKGWIPSSILDIAMPIAQLQFVECVRKLVININNGKAP